jgi:hypothetical protein
MTTLIGIGGALRAGKDTIADHLVGGYLFKRHQMSDPLAEALLVLDPIIFYDGRQRYSELVAEVGYTEAKKNPEVRRLLQTLGTEIGRQMIGENTWVDIAARNIDEDRHIYRRDVVITGIRFKNELDMIRSRGGVLLYVRRPALETSSSSAHASETSLTEEDFDEVVVNDGSIADLEDKVDLELASWRSVPAQRSKNDDLMLDFGTRYDW